MEMFTIENNVSAVKQVVRGSSSTGFDICKLEALCERLLCVQPQSEPLLKRLLIRSRRVGGPPAFAPIQDRHCSACYMTIAIARIQKAKSGEFINCANCITFLYYDPR